MDEGCVSRHAGAEHMPMQVGGDAGGGGIEANVEASLVQVELAGKLRNGRGLIWRDELEWGIMRRIGERAVGALGQGDISRAE